ncbi:cysteine proteinase rd21a-like protein [Trifolium pratense]|uniref:Cysteine proteinase rd21a-like protein n=1 Tax=Trifolium pratense TaxID=57577 RepID=A0A2K3NB95_TRIPR|nr:cysteine proteinase rd21a-like protein [Trifolium pratense]
MTRVEDFQQWKRYFPPVEDQGGANSCFAFAACSLVEELWCFLTGERILLSKQDLYSHLIRSEDEDIIGQYMQTVVKTVY